MITPSVEQAIKSLKEARSSLIEAKSGLVEKAVLPWRESIYEEPTVNYDQLIRDIELQIIDVEKQHYRDPEQDAEILMELRAEMAMNGVRDDPHLYMHTPFEEELFQEGIQRQIEYGYYDEDGYYNEGLSHYHGPGKCMTCGGAVWEDEVTWVHGWQTCEACNEEALAFMFLLSFISNVGVFANRWETEWMFKDEDDEED